MCDFHERCSSKITPRKKFHFPELDVFDNTLSHTSKDEEKKFVPSFKL